MATLEKTRQFDLNSIRRWIIIQVASLLPLSICVALIMYFRDASGLGLVCLFLLVIFGVLIPELKADTVQSHLILEAEQEEFRAEFQQFSKEVLQRLTEKQTSSP